MNVERGAWWATDHMGGKSQTQLSDYALQYSCLENPMYRGAWWAIQSLGVTKSQIQLKQLHIAYMNPHNRNPIRNTYTHTRDILPDLLILGTCEWCGSAGISWEEQTRPRTRVKNRTFILLACMVDSAWSFFLRGCGRPSGLERT